MSQGAFLKQHDLLGNKTICQLRQNYGILLINFAFFKNAQKNTAYLVHLKLIFYVADLLKNY